MGKAGRTRASIAAAAVLAAANWSLGQIAASWIGAATGNWTTGANWTSNPDFPSAGGTAVFNAGATSVSLGSSITLNALRFGTNAQIDIGTGQFLFTGAALIDAEAYKQSPPGTSYFTGHEVNASVVVPGGPNLRVRGPGAVTLKGGSSSIQNLIVVDSGARLGITTPSALGSGSAILLNDATLRTVSPTGTFTTTAIDIQRPIQIHPNGGTLAGMTAPMRIGTVISGGGPLTFGGPAGVELTGQNAWAGDARVVGGGTVNLAITGLGSLPFYNSMEVSGMLTVSYSSGSIPDRLGFGTLAVRGGTVMFGSFGSTEQIGSLSLVGGRNVLSTDGATSGTFNLGSSGLDRRDRGTLEVRATGLGVGTFSRTVHVNFDSPATVPLVGGGGAAGSTNISIVPFMWHNQFTVNTLLTYDANGLRPLNGTTEFATSLPAEAVSTANVRLNGSILNEAKTINALVLNPGAHLGGSGTLTVTSGAVLSGTSASTTMITCPLDFGGAEGVISGVNTLGGPISGAGGVTYSGNASSLTISTVSSTYTGTTTINNGTVQIFLPTNLVAGMPGPFGADTSPIVLVGRGTGAVLAINGSNRQFGRDILVRSDPELLKGFEPVLRASGTISGAIELQGPLRLETFAPTNITGAICGPGRLVIGGNLLTISGDNTFSGGVDLGASTLTVLSDTALGTGTLFVGGAPSGGPPPDGAIFTGMGSPATIRTLTNPIVLVAGLRLSGQPLLNLTGPIDLNGEQRTITAFAPQQPTISGSIFGGELRWSGTGTWSGNNAQRATFINTISTLTVTGDHALGVASRLTQVGTANLSIQSTLDLRGPLNIPAHPMVLYANLRSVIGDNTWNGPIHSLGTPTISVADGTTFTVAGGIDGAATGQGFTLAKTGGGRLVISNIRMLGGLSVLEGTAALLPDGTDAGTSKVASLEIAGAAEAWTATVDLAENAFLIDHDGTSDPTPNAVSQLASGHAGGAWTGTGIHSTAAAAAAANGADPHKTAVGYASAADLGVTTFRGQGVDDMALILAYVYAGDANLDRIVDVADFSLVGANFNAGGIWFRGDFNYDTITDIADFSILAANFNQTLAAAGPRGRAVPEPCGLIAVGFLISVLLGRRRP